MDHIVSCMADARGDDALGPNQYIVKPASPQPPSDSAEKQSLASSEKPFVWRMQNQAERKYQLFPKDKQPSTPAARKGLDPEQAFALAMNQNAERSDKSAAGNGLRIRIKEHNQTRRRKVSVPETGPMTTVQEVPMDSPTIPGRPAVHERSISAPGHSWRHHQALLEGRTSSPSPTPEEVPERGEPSRSLLNVLEPKRGAGSRLHPLSPKSLTPLVIPAQQSTAPRLTRQLSLNRLRSAVTPAVEPTTRSARTDDSPKTRAAFTPLSASALTATTMSSATTAMSATTLATPVSAPVHSNPWAEGTFFVSPIQEVSPKADAGLKNSTPRSCHRRQQSGSGSIMDRGRPRKRTDNNGGPLLQRSDSKQSRSAERRAFEQLPKGWKAADAIKMLNQSEVNTIQKQALQQASRFEVLRKEDVDKLSIELRQLDERTDYLRRTYSSLRAGRRNLHSRICQYLRSPRTARFSHDSMLKQEEALAELDTSIDDWVGKLDQAENRRTRVRQKLLEHVAAAATISAAASGGVVGVSETLQLAMGIRPVPGMQNGFENIATPPRSPTKTPAPHAQLSSPTSQPTKSNSPSPQRAFAQVPSTILEQPWCEEEAAIQGLDSKNEEERARSMRRDVESIRIYADSEVYALLADVEQEITKMGNGGTPPKEGPQPKSTYKTEAESRQLHRARTLSHEKLNGGKLTEEQRTKLSNPTPLSPLAPSPPLKDTPTEETGGLFILSNAVFKPVAA